MIKALSGKNYKIIVYLFFAVFLFLGINIYKDYGIPWDEGISRNNGILALEYVVKGDTGLFNYRDKDYGPAFEIFLVAMERALNLTPRPRETYLMRHLANFLLFYLGVVFFYLLCKKRFASCKAGLLGSLFLILSPRIFADSFYNSKDIAYLSLFVISVYTLFNYLDKKTLPAAFFHALACALLIDIRIAGIMLIFFTVFFTAMDMALIASSRVSIRKDILSLAFYLLMTIILVVFFWPTLWRNPLINFKEALVNMSHFRWQGNVLYLGEYIKASALPWHYIPLWIMITTPLTYTFFFCVGYFYAIKDLIANPRGFYFKRRPDLIFLLWISLPLLIVIILRPVLYDAWRQMFFIYPAFLIFSLIGLKALFKFLRARFLRPGYILASSVFILFFAVDLSGVFKAMVKGHPYQNVYFNVFAGKNAVAIKNNFELDYWGLSYRKALEYILSRDTDKTIKIYAANYPGEINAYMLDPDDRARLVYVRDIKEAKYFLSNYRWHKEEYPCKDEFYALKANGIKIMVVCRL